MILEQQIKPMHTSESFATKPQLMLARLAVLRYGLTAAAKPANHAAATF